MHLKLDRTLAKLTNKIYLDTNATSPLSEAVIEALLKGDFAFANPSSLHQSGKKAKKQIQEVIDYFKEVYSLTSEDVLFHSGATESIHLFCHSLKKNDVFIGFESDHKAVTSHKNFFNEKGIENYWLSPLQNGDFPLTEVKNLISQFKDKRVFLNYTWVNNETGVVWPLQLIDSFYDKNFFIHVDATQSVGKISNSYALNFKASFYTFSGHKFGSLKGVGMSFINKNFPLKKLFLGGEQQNHLRAGTENLHGIYSLKIAFSEWREKFDEKKLGSLKNKIEEVLKDKLGEDIIFLDLKATFKSLNTISFIHKKKSADTLIPLFDLQGIEVGSGSACSSGRVEENMMAKLFGYSQYSKNVIRMSLSPLDIDREEEILIKLRSINI